MLNRTIWEDTVKILSNYEKKVDQTLYETINLKKDHKIRNGKIIFEKLDTFTCAEKYKNSHVAVLNFANAVRPALGKPIHETQEEDLMRRSSLPLYLYSDLVKLHGNELYPIHPTNLIYSRNVKVFKKCNGEKCPVFSVDVITAAAINRPVVRNGLYYKKSQKIHMYNLIEHIIKSAVFNEVEVLVLGAFGCGAFLCPIKETAEMFCEISRKYCKYFKYIVFSIPDEKTMIPFRKEF